MKTASPISNSVRTNYFPNLNALRFIAASMVLIGHTEQVKGFHQYKCYFTTFPSLFQGGHLAVIFFFVLSGFLITHIIYGKIKKNRFSITDFYKKRIVRIWPLYYFIILLGLFVIPEINFMAHNSQWVNSLKELNSKELRETTILYFLVLPNLSLNYGVFEYLGHTWSIGVEEQFYLIWPLLLTWFHSRVMLLLFSVIGLVWSLRLISAALGWHQFWGFITVFRIDSMAFGGIMAVILSQGLSIKRYIINSWVEISAIIITFIFYFYKTRLGIISDEVFSVLFSIIIINAACNPRTVIRLERFRLIRYLGQVSYGIYMYHPIIAMVSLLIFNWLHPSYMASLSSNIVFYLIVFGISIGTATLSYEFLEKPIMHFGRRKWLSVNK